MDSEKVPAGGKPIFYSEVEYCDNDFASNCRFDVTGQFVKKVLQR